MASHLVHKNVPHSDVLEMGASQIISMYDSLEEAHWREEITRLRLTQVATQGSGKDLNKALKPIEKSLDPDKERQNDTAALIRDLGGKPKQ